MPASKESSDRSARLARGLLSVAGGAASGQLISLLTLPVLTRLLAPESFGYVSRALAVAMVVSVAMTLRVDGAMFSTPLPRRQGAIARAAMTVALLVLLLLGGLALAVPVDVLAAAGFVGTVDAVAVLAVAFAMAVFNVASNRAAAARNYGALARSKPIKQVIEVAALAGLAAAGAPGWLLLGSTVLACAVAAVTLQLPVHWSGRRDLQQLVAVVRRYRAFIVYDLPAAVLVHGRLALPLLFLGQRFDLATVGLFAIVQRLLDAPAALASSSAGMVYRGKLGTHPRPDQLFLRMAGGLLAAAVVLVGLAVLVPDEFIVAVLGAAWVGVAPMIEALAIYGLVRIVALPLGTTFYATEGVRINLMLQVVGVVLIGVVFVWCPADWEAESVVLAYAAGQAAFYATFLLVAYRTTVRMAKGGRPRPGADPATVDGGAG